MKSARLVASLAGLVLVAAGLTACQNHVGAAAFVGSTRISESTVASYLARTAAESTQTDSSTGQTEVTNPKSQVLSILISTRLFDLALQRAPGGEPSDSKVDAARKSFMAAENVTDVAEFEAVVVKSGYTSAFADLYIDANAKFGLLSQAYGDTGDGSKVIAAINNLHQSVEVSPRYGTWSSSALAVSTGPSLPSFLTLAPTPAPAISG